MIGMALHPNIRMFSPLHHLILFDTIFFHFKLTSELEKKIKFARHYAPPQHFHTSPKIKKRPPCPPIDH